MGRATVRLKLTVLLGTTMLAAGVCLIGINFLLVRHNISNTVSPATGQDIVLRAAKLANEPELSEPDRAQLQSIAHMTPSQAADLVRHRPTLSTTVADPLFADLPNDVRSKAVHDLVSQAVLAVAATAVGAMVAGWFVAGRLLRPLQRITETAQRLSTDDLDQRIALTGPDDELKRLATTFDAMLDRLAASFRAQARFVANASHQLRTPLTIMRTQLEMTLRRPTASNAELRQMGETVLDAVLRSNRVVDSLLLLARGEAGVIDRKPVNLATVATDALDIAREHAAVPHIEMHDVLEDAWIAGEPVLVEQLAWNLIDNASRYNVEGGWLRVVTRTEGELSVLIVENTTPPLADVQIAEFFEPFRRLADRVHANDGTGLGLSIVKAVAVAHGGTVMARRSPDGHRVTIEVALPRAVETAFTALPASSQSHRA